MDGATGVKALRTTAQDDGVAGLHAQPCGIGRNVGPAFVNDADDAEGHRNTLYGEPVGPPPLRQDAPQGIGQLRNRIEPGGHRFDAVFIEHQAVQHRGAQPAFARGAHVHVVGGNDFVAA